MGKICRHQCGIKGGIKHPGQPLQPAELKAPETAPAFTIPTIGSPLQRQRTGQFCGLQDIRQAPENGHEDHPKYG